MNDLKNSEELRLKLIKLVRVDGCSIAKAALELRLKPRTCQEFFAKEKQWMKQWWNGYESDIETSQPNIIDKLKLAATIKKVSVDDFGELSFNVPEIRSKDVDKDNTRILLISDMHIPYHHPDTLSFLGYLKNKYNPTRVICLGDELDKHALSFHDSDPDLPSAGDELRLSLPVIKKLKELFPVMDILESNHGSLLYRKAHHHGIPRQYLKSYNEVLGVDDDWKWWYDMTIDLPNGNKCYLHHGKSANVTKTSQTMSMCAVQGHYHETFKIEYWGNPNGLFWGMQAGCLIDDRQYAFNYNNVNLHRPLIGTGLIINGLPVLEAMVLNSEGRWVGE